MLLGGTEAYFGPRDTNAILYGSLFLLVPALPLVEVLRSSGMVAWPKIDKAAWLIHNLDKHLSHIVF